MRIPTLKTLLLAACVCVNPAFADEVITIGHITPLTGPVAYNGKSDTNGANLAVQDRNKKGGVLGKQVSIIHEDDQCQPAKGINAAEKLIQKDRVPVIVGGFCSSVTSAVMPLAEKYKFPLLTGISSAVDLTERGNPWFFRTAETDGLLAEAFAQVLIDTLKLKTVAYIGLNDDWGRGGVDEFSKEIEALGAKTVLKEYFDPGATDFYTLLTRIRAAKPDGIFVAAHTQDGSIIVKQMKELGISSRVFGVGSWAGADFIKLAGKAGEGIYAAVPYSSSLDTEGNRNFVASYQQAYGNSPDKYAMAGYNAVNIVMDAIERAGSAEPEKIRDALKKTDYQAPNGKFMFDDKGQAYGFSAVLVQITDGKLQVVADTTIKKHD